MSVEDQPLFTTVFEESGDFTPPNGSVYVFGTSVEDRSANPSNWSTADVPVTFVEVFELADTSLVAKDSAGQEIALRSEDAVWAFWERQPSGPLFVDITGLSHHVWAPLVRSALRSQRNLNVVYREPIDYRHSRTPMEGEIFDLSTRIKGIAPIPGFTSLAEPAADATFLVPLLGFEGTRFAFVLEQVQPPGGKIVPVIGVPGFRADYPFHTYLGNRRPLVETRSWPRVRYAIASCPFSLFYLLDEIASMFPNDLMQVALIGTKPHALGAVLYAMSSLRPVELVYDHPIRKPERTSGASRTHVYDVSAFGETGGTRWN